MISYQGRAVPLKMKLLIVAALAVGVLLMAPSAHSQVAPAAPAFGKTASPNPATVGQEIVFTIAEINNTAAPINATFTDVFPSSLVF